MAKKRVHEIAKERGISSKEVLATLQAAGFDVKAAASSVDERDIAKAFSNGADGAGAATDGETEPATAASRPPASPDEKPAPPAAGAQPPGDGGQGAQR